ncbi:hypothetical protein ColLi_01338 [Colletotrichum liriopes]|uniref:Uncharacterized protein n=1 Tax=Colletotrichum liriopes TaxID=708192 RepID=A0AA37GCS6_9PEZI|nr:hypothetical protein ColLi_01338 [Colletotrichum liriopes]
MSTFKIQLTNAMISAANVVQFRNARRLLGCRLKRRHHLIQEVQICLIPGRDGIAENDNEWYKWGTNESPVTSQFNRVGTDQWRNNFQVSSLNAPIFFHALFWMLRAVLAADVQSSQNWSG